MTHIPPITVILPAHNEAATIGETVRALRDTYSDYEILVVDDASTDNTADTAAREGARVLRNDVNRGYGGALKRGMRRARGETVVFMDADGQHDARDVARLVDCLAGCDMAVGQRSRQDQVAVRRPGKWLLTAVASYLVEQRIPDLNSGFRALYRKDGLSLLPILPNGFSLTTTMTLAMVKNSFDVRYVPIRVAPRAGGRSTVGYFRDGLRTLLLVLRVIVLFNPMKVFMPMSLLALLVGAAYATYSILTEHNLSEMSVLLILSGMMLFCLGLLADRISNLRRGG